MIYLENEQPLLTREMTVCYPLALSAVFMLPISDLLRSGKLIGGLADFRHGLNLLMHGFHLLIQGAIMGGKIFRFGLPVLRS